MPSLFKNHIVFFKLIQPVIFNFISGYEANHIQIDLLQQKFDCKYNIIIFIVYKKLSATLRFTDSPLFMKKFIYRLIRTISSLVSIKRNAQYRSISELRLRLILSYQKAKTNISAMLLCLPLITAICLQITWQ